MDSHGNPGEGFWPRLIAVLFIGLGVLLGILTVMKKKEPDRIIDLNSSPVRKAYLATGLSIFYGFLLLLAGFFVATVVFVPLIMTLMGEKRPKVIVASAVGISFGIWLVFLVGFKSALPESIFLG